MDPAVFVRRNTAISAPPLVPEIRLHLATEITPIRQATEESFARSALPPAFWAFAWVGGQALACYILDHPALVAGRFPLDFGAGRVLWRSPPPRPARLPCSPPRSTISPPLRSPQTPR